MVGIVTPLKVNNYGSKLQAYAVQQKLSQYGMRSEILLFRPKRDYHAFLSIKKYTNRLKSVCQGLLLRYHGISAQASERAKAISSLDQRCYSCSKEIFGYDELKAYAKRYSAIVCGSDQVWSPLGVEGGFYSVEFVQGIPKIAFSPSFGVSELPEEMKDRYRKFIGDFSTLSVRETSGSELIFQLTGKKAPVTLDPTLTLPREAWDTFMGCSSVAVPKERYIFCYFLGKNPMHRQAVQRLKKLTGCKILMLPHFKGYTAADKDFADEEMYNVSPADFVKLIANAAYVCTDSFHGSVFSILYRKPFFCFERYSLEDRNSTNTRIYSLLEHLDLMGRMIAEEGQIQEKYLHQIEYEKVNQRLDDLRVQTDAYLARALSLLESKRK